MHRSYLSDLKINPLVIYGKGGSRLLVVPEKIVRTTTGLERRDVRMRPHQSFDLKLGVVFISCGLVTVRVL